MKESIRKCPICIEQYSLGFKEGYQKAVEYYRIELVKMRQARPIVYKVDKDVVVLEGE